ncbi:anti-phage protein KwaB [Neobacillus sp. PS2-9]|uniref:anti-phage protein KwaB n=1 Tax=Neobacillus sp. PS2-9 TaxID=3070676 RepID=UPI0027E0DDC2|nr:anti-phage protein KwaB [Neobacillus sp. PS2-9]WML57448.1 anti-phage protein KwaB [Neobacillus sp. PS2-9]
MNKSELVTVIKTFIDNQNGFVAEIFFVLKNSAGDILKRADLESAAQTNLKNEFIVNLNERIIKNEELSILPISNFDERKNVLFEYDLDQIPVGLNILEELQRTEDFPLFSFSNDRLDDITGIIFLIHYNDNTLISYKRNYPINLYKRDRNGIPLIKWGNETRFKEMPDDILRIYPDFDFFRLNDELFIRNINILEKFFSFHEIIKSTAVRALSEIESANLIEDIDSLEEMIDDITFARKLTKIGSHSPVLNRIPADTIIEFVNTYPTLKGKFEFNEDNSRIKLTTKKSKRLFLKLLNDDYLQSQLTELHYDSLAKEAVEI